MNHTFFTNFTHQNRFRRHLSFTNTDNQQKCYMEKSELEFEDICKFLRKSIACGKDVGILNYLDIFICRLKVLEWGNSTVLSIFVILLLILYGLIFFTLCKYFLLPNYVSLRTKLACGSYGFGFIFIPITIFLPQRFHHETSHFSKKYSKEMASQFVMIFSIYCVGLAAVCFHRHQKIRSLTFIRENIFLLLGNIFVYLVVHFKMFYDNQLPSERRYFPIKLYSTILGIVYMTYLIVMGYQAYIPDTQKAFIFDATLASVSNEYILNWSNTSNVHNYSICRLFWNALLIHKNNKMSRFKAAVLCPIFAFFALFIPVMHKERLVQGWCIIVMIIGAVVCPFLMLIRHHSGYYFVWSALVAFFGVCGLLMFCKSREIPSSPHYEIVCIMGIWNGCLCICIIQYEVYALIWQIISFMADWTDDALVAIKPLSIMMGLLILIVSFITQEYTEMAYGFVYGFMMFRTFVTLPFITLSANYNDNETITITANGETYFTYLMVIIPIIFLAILIANFELRHSLGFALMIIIFICLLQIILNGTNLLHPYGGVHSYMDVQMSDDIADWA